MKILVTGYKGFIGQNLVNALKSNHQVALFDWGDEFPDISGYDWCIHLGAIASTTESDVDKILEQNYDFSRLIINQCQSSGVNLQYASSASVYGMTSEFKETSPPRPVNAYAWSKYLFERYVAGFKDRWTIKVQGFRYFNVYGPFEDHKGDQASPYHKFAQQAQTTGVIKLFENSDQYKRDFVPVERIIDVHQKFFDVPESGIWNIGSGQAVSFETIAKDIASKYNAQIEYIPMPANLANHYQAYTCADITKLRTTLNENSNS